MAVVTAIVGIVYNAQGAKKADVSGDTNGTLEGTSTGKIVQTKTEDTRTEIEKK